MAALLGEDVPEGHGAEAEEDRESHVQQGLAPCPGAQQVVGLQAKSGEGSKAAAEANHHEDADGLRHLEAAAGHGEATEEADDEGADDVDEDRRPGKAGAVLWEHFAAERITKSTADGAAEGDP